MVFGRKFATYLKTNWQLFLLLSFFVLISYFPSFFNSFVSDDFGLSLDNSFAETLQIITSDPLAVIVAIQQALIYELCFNIAGCIRVPNLVFHFLNTILVFQLVKLTVSRRTAIWAAILFSLHPLLSETVNWISALGYIEYTFVTLLSLILYIYFDRSGNKKFYFLALGLMVISLFITRRVFGLPLFLLYEFSLSQPKPLPSKLKYLLPFILLIVVWVTLQLLSLGSQVSLVEESNKLTSGRISPLVQIPIAIGTYLSLFFWPMGLTFYHSDLGFQMWQIIGGYLVLSILGALMIYSLWRNLRLFFFLSFFIVSILIYLNPFGTNWIVAERYVYLGMVGLVASFAILVTPWLTKKSLKPWILGLLVVFTLFLSIRTLIRTLDWKSEDSIALSILRVVPNDPRGLYRKAVIAEREGREEEARQLYEQTIAVNAYMPAPYLALGSYYAKRNQLVRAEEYYLKAIEVGPDAGLTYRYLSQIYFLQGKFEDAIQTQLKGIEILGDSESYSNLGYYYSKAGKTTEAQQAFQKALEIDPGNSNAQNQLRELNP